MADKEKNPDADIAELVDKGLKLLNGSEDEEDLEARRRFLNEVKRHGIAAYRALVRYLLRKQGEKTNPTTPRKGGKSPP